jgi:hypothetical protein
MKYLLTFLTNLPEGIISAMLTILPLPHKSHTDQDFHCPWACEKSLILLHVDFKCEVLTSTKSVHYTSETSMGIFGNPFRTNLRAMKPCAVVKGTRWLKIMYP